MCVVSAEGDGDTSSSGEGNVTSHPENGGQTAQSDTASTPATECAVSYWVRGILENTALLL